MKNKILTKNSLQRLTLHQRGFIKDSILKDEFFSALQCNVRNQEYNAKGERDEQTDLRFQVHNEFSRSVFTVAHQVGSWLVCSRVSFQLLLDDLHSKKEC